MIERSALNARVPPAVAIVGLGAWYPGAPDVRALWENVLARRRQFRRFPDVRLPAADYHDPAPRAPDKTYGTRGGFIDGFEFDWARRRIPKKTVEVTDVVHWLALEVALAALADSGYDRSTLPAARTGVIVGNTMTGEQARTSIMRLRWPYVARSLRAAAAARGLPAATVAELEGTMEELYKSVFPAVTEDSLAGSLSNTIAGRICNFLDAQGGGYTVDGACASGMIAVTTAAAALHHGELDFALAGGVDISLDAMELVGFAKVGALTRGDMNVYDRRGSGFIPGEGCGFVALKRLEDARRDGDYVYAVIRGWGISSDGAGGLTAPNAAAQAIMLRRAYERAGYSPHTLAFVEGHGTATVAGDKAELEGIQQAMDADGPLAPRSCGMTSFKSLIGHTKAASGLGGLIKATVAANRRIIPPTAGCTDPNRVFGRAARGLYPVLTGQIRDPGETLRVGASAMGFGGINCHVALESGDPPAAALAPVGDERALMASHQETELFVLGAQTVSQLAEAVGGLRARAAGMSVAELTDLAAELARHLASSASVRAAVVAGSPDELTERIDLLAELLCDRAPDAGPAALAGGAVAVGGTAGPARVAFLFPGQGSQQLGMARVLVERFPWARDLVERADRWLAESGATPVADLMFRPLDRALDTAQREEWAGALGATEAAQPAICLASLLWARYLERLGVRPTAVAGHSLGELTAFCVAGAFDDRTLIRLAGLRGRTMAAGDGAAGTMAGLACSAAAAEELVARVRGYAVVANRNSPTQTVVAGERASVEEVMRLAEAEGVRAVALPVSNAFHSALVAGAAERLRQEAEVPERLAEGPVAVHSSMTGEPVAPGLYLRRHFADQVVSPVDFVTLAASVAGAADVLLEVGPGRVLTGLVRATGAGATCRPIEATPGADADLNLALAELFVRGVDIEWPELYAGRLVRPFTPASELRFIENQLERLVAVAPPEDEGARNDWAAPALAASAGLTGAELEAYLERRARFLAGVIRADLDDPGAPAPPETPARDMPYAPAADSPGAGEVLLALVEAHTGFPPETLSLDMRLLEDLNLDSIKAAELLSEAGARLGAEPDFDPGTLQGLTLAEIAEVFRAGAGPPASSADALAGRGSWVRTFVVERVERPLAGAALPALRGVTVAVLSEPTEAPLAEAVADVWRERGALARVAGYCDPGPADHVVALPRGGGTERPALEGAVRRLRAIAGSRPTTLACVGFAGAGIDQCAAAFAAAIHHERPDLKVRVIEAPAAIAGEDLARRVLAEIAGAEPYAFAVYDAELVRRVLRPKVEDAAERPPGEIAWSAEDVVVATGGAKGITAECALGFAAATGVRTVLVGRAPGGGEVDRALGRYAAAGLTARYRACDVTDPAAVSALLDGVRDELGPITGVIHGAGANLPRPADRVTAAEAAAEAGAKVAGAMHLCQALDADPPKLICGLSSVIAFTGMPGNAWYGFANEALEVILRGFADAHPATAVVAPAFGVWADVGMGARLGADDYLARMGVASIPTVDGVRRFVELMESAPGGDRVIVTARLRGLDTWAPEPTPAPGADRFLESIVHVEPGVEVVARATLTLERDAYLGDHVYRGSHLLPATFGLEAMAEAAAHALGRTSLGAVRFERIRFERPIVADPERGVRIEVRAEVIERRAAEDPVRVRAAIGCESSGFTADHFSATLVFDALADPPRSPVELGPAPLALEPRRDLYGGVLFQGPRFQRLEAIDRLDSAACVFRARETEEPFLLGDPFFRDTLLQAAQLLAPQMLALPVAIDVLEVFRRPSPGGSRIARVEAEGEHDGFQRAAVIAVDDDGRVLERLSGYRTRILERRPDYPSAEQLADPAARDAELLCRRLDELAAVFEVAAPTAVLAQAPGLHGLDRAARHQAELPVLERALAGLGGEDPPAIGWLDSGQPVVDGADTRLGVSLSHDDAVCLAVAGDGPQGCDIARVSRRSHDEWTRLLGPARAPLLGELGAEEPRDRAGTRIWAALESLRKAAGGQGPVDLAVARRAGDAVLLRGGAREVLTFPLRLTRGPERLVGLVVAPTAATPANRVSVARAGSGPPVLFVHGSVLGAATWAAQRPLCARWTTLVLDRRGFGSSPAADREDFEVDARDILEALGDGAHLVAHSYGALGALLAATARPRAVWSLTLVEPVAYSVAADVPAVARALVELVEYDATGPREPRAFLAGFLRMFGVTLALPDPLTEPFERATRLLMKANPPFAARIRLAELARARIPTLVVSGGHAEAFEAICDRLADRLDGERTRLPGAGHAVPAVGEPFNLALERFLSAR